jgi:hypothetical protein
MHWLGHDIGIVGNLGRNTFVVALQVNYLVYAETNSPKYRIFCVLSKKTCSVTALDLESNAVITVKLHLNCRFYYKNINCF